MKGKCLVISGGTRGIGRAIVIEFANLGVVIAFSYFCIVELGHNLAIEYESEYGI